MRIVSLGNASEYARNILTTKIGKKRPALSTAVSAVILVAAVSILGSMMLIWANTTFNAESKRMGDYYEKNSNVLKETFIIEDTWLSKNPLNYVNVTLRNIGDIAIDIKEVKVIALDANSAQIRVATATPPFTPGATDGVIASKTTLRIDVSIQWNDAKTLDIFVTTERGSIERIIWLVG